MDSNQSGAVEGPFPGSLTNLGASGGVPPKINKMPQFKVSPKKVRKCPQALPGLGVLNRIVDFGEPK